MLNGVVLLTTRLRAFHRGVHDQKRVLGHLMVQVYQGKWYLELFKLLGFSNIRKPKSSL